MHTTPIIFSIFLLLVAKTAGSHVTVKGLYFLLPVIIIDGLVWIPLPPPSTSNNHLAHTHVCTDQHPNGLLQPPHPYSTHPHFLDRPRNRSFIQQVHTYVCWETSTHTHIHMCLQVYLMEFIVVMFARAYKVSTNKRATAVKCAKQIW